MAAKHGLTEMVKLLVNSGANLKQKNSEGLKPQAVALQSGQKETARTITALKLTPALDSLGIFSALRRVQTLEQENQELKEKNQSLELRLASLEGASKEAVALNP